VKVVSGNSFTLWVDVNGFDFVCSVVVPNDEHNLLEDKIDDLREAYHGKSSNDTKHTSHIAWKFIEI
jgi:hypothetical protein